MVEPRYRIGTVARLSGLSTHVIRVWERRYGALDPDRSGGGARLYSPADLERLRLLKRAVDRGHAIGQVARLARRDLERLAGEPPAPSRLDEDERARSFVEQFLDAVRKFDGERAEELLDRAAVVFSARSLALEVLGPLLERIGDSWAIGELCTASEHVASALVRDRLSGILRQLSKRRRAELAVVTTPEGELHELGALLVAVTFAIHGYRVLYLGPNLPASEIARAARGSSARIVALSVVALDAKAAVRGTRELAGLLPERVELLLGGPRAREIQQELGPRVLVPGTLADLEHWLETRRRSDSSRRSSR